MTKTGKKNRFELTEGANDEKTSGIIVIIIRDGSEVHDNALRRLPVVVHVALRASAPLGELAGSRIDVPVVQWRR